MRCGTLSGSRAGSSCKSGSARSDVGAGRSSVTRSRETKRRVTSPDLVPAPQPRGGRCRGGRSYLSCDRSTARERFGDVTITWLRAVRAIAPPPKERSGDPGKAVGARAVSDKARSREARQRLRSAVRETGNQPAPVGLGSDGPKIVAPRFLRGPTVTFSAALGSRTRFDERCGGESGLRLRMSRLWSVCGSCATRGSRRRSVYLGVRRDHGSDGRRATISPTRSPGR